MIGFSDNNSGGMVYTGPTTLMTAAKAASIAGQNAAANNQALQLANAISNQNGIIDLRTNMGPIELYNKPTSTIITAVGKNAANANAAVTTYAFNNDVFNQSVLASDGTTASTQATYNDGFSGRNIQQHLRNENFGRGLCTSAITFTCFNSAGDQDPTILQQLNFTPLTYAVIGGRQVPMPIDVSSAIRNTQFQSGILTVLVEIWLNSMSQLSWSTPSGATITANIEWKA
jgi:hypothetical protein